MFKKRSDAYYCYDVSQLMRIFPFIFKRRCDCQVFYEIEYDITNLTKFVKEYNNSVREYNKTAEKKKYALRVSTAVLIAFARTLAMRPKVNRFIKNKITWQRKEVSEVFLARKSMDPDAPELTEELVFDPKGDFDSYVEIIESYIDRCENSDIDELNANEIVLGRLFKFLPKWLISFVIGLYGIKDTIHGVGKWLHKTDGLHGSIFIANLSSIGVASSAPHHHLYQWGTTSIFCILGPVTRNRLVNEAGEPVGYKDTMKISFTVDERICDGLYFIKTLKVIGDYLSNPESMKHIPTDEEMPHLMTKKEYKQKIKEQKRALKLKRKEKKNA